MSASGVSPTDCAANDRGKRQVELAGRMAKAFYSSRPGCLAGRMAKAFYSSKPGCRPSGVRLNNFFPSLILIFHPYTVSKTHFYHTILQDTIRRHPGLEL